MSGPLRNVISIMIIGILLGVIALTVGLAAEDGVLIGLGVFALVVLGLAVAATIWLSRHIADSK